MPFTVVVFGFYGSKMRHVEKYGRAWELNVPGVKRCILNECSGVASFLLLGSLRDAKSIAEQLKDETEPVVFHVLSNRGMLAYLRTVRLLPKTVRVAGVVFDSCPGSLSPWLFFRATAANQKDRKLKMLHEIIPYAIFALFAYTYGIVRSLLVHIFIEFNQRLWSKLYHRYVARLDPAKCPSLFLYSKADHLVTDDYVTATADDRQQHIGRVQRKCWETSGHVRHIYDFESEYIEQLKQFVRALGI